MSACTKSLRRAWDEDQGWALVSVLYVVAMLALLAAAVQSLLLTSAALDKRVWDRARIDGAFHAAIARAVLGVGDSRPASRWAVDGSEEAFQFDGVHMSIRVQDQLGLIDLNAADVSMLKRLLQAGGLEDDDASKLAARIVDWRSPASDMEDNSDTAYDAAHRPYRPRHGPFQSVSELRLVLGMTPALFTRLEPALTVHSHHPAFETATAPELVLLALYLERPEEVTRVLDERRQAAASGVGDTLPVGSSLAGRTLSVDATLAFEGRSHHKRAIIMLTEDPQNPYLVLAWQ